VVVSSIQYLAAASLFNIADAASTDSITPYIDIMMKGLIALLQTRYLT